MISRPFLCVALLSGCSGNGVSGTWELVDATWTALEFEDNGTTRSLEVELVLEHARKDVTGNATMTKTTTMGDQSTTELSNDAEVDGEEESGGAVYLDASPLFAFECEFEGDQMVCTDSDLDMWEFSRTSK